MNSSQGEIRSLIQLTLIGFGLNVVFGFSGYMQPPNSYLQLLFFQIADAGAIMACVLAGRYVGIKGEHVAASAFILLGITHGISLASAGVESLNIEKGIGVVMPMIPAFALMFWLSIVPLWLRLVAFISPISFIITYIQVLNGEPYFGWYSYLGYMSWMLTELAWAFYLRKDYIKDLKV